MSRCWGFSQQLLQIIQLILRNPERGYVRVAHNAEVLLSPSLPEVTQELTEQ